jgi:hypothetical protein
MKNTFFLLTVSALMFLAVNGAPAAGQSARVERAAKAVVVHTKFGGQLLGYDVDRNGTEGMLSEYVMLSSGKLLIATETFDQTTGKIIKVVAKKNETNDNFLTWGVTGSHIGLQEFDQVTGIFVSKRTYQTIDPLDGNKFTKPWTPPFTKNDIIINGPANQGSANAAVLYFDNGVGFQPYVIATNVAANTFGKPVEIKDQDFSQLSLMDFDSQTNQAVVTGSVGCFDCSEKIALVDLTKDSVTYFAGIGLGGMNGIAVDSGTGTACTTSQSDDSAEFYDLAKKTGTIIKLPNDGPYSGVTVANDPAHKLFFITHPEPASDGEVNIFDEKGNLIKTLSGFPMGPGGVYLALNPSTRTGFAPGFDETTLVSFSY